MLNPFYYYSLTWGAVILLYQIPMTKYNQGLEIGLLFFFLSTILCSLLLGIKYRNIFRFKEVQNEKLTLFPVLLIAIGYAIEFVNAGFIPFVAFCTGTAEYGDFTGMKGLHVLITGAGSYYAIKYYYFALCTLKKRRKYLTAFVLILGFILLTFTRSQLIFIAAVAAILTLSYAESKKKLTFKGKVYLIVFALFLLYMNGGLGNLRQGFSWNDSSYITGMGKFYWWPPIVPDVFKWAYLYIITPIANLNYNVQISNISGNLSGFLAELVPESLGNRIFPMSQMKTELLASYFTVSTGWSKAYINCGMLGVYALYSFTVLLFLVCINHYCRKNDKKNMTQFLALYSGLYIFMFFTNTFVSMSFSLVLWIYLFKIFLSHWKKVRIVKKKALYFSRIRGSIG